MSWSHTRCKYSRDFNRQFKSQRRLALDGQLSPKWLRIYTSKDLLTTLNEFLLTFFNCLPVFVARGGWRVDHTVVVFAGRQRRSWYHGGSRGWARQVRIRRLEVAGMGRCGRVAVQTRRVVAHGHLIAEGSWRRVEGKVGGRHRKTHGSLVVHAAVTLLLLCPA